MASHSPATSDVTALIRDVIDEHYPDLAEAEVTINALFAYAPEGKPAVKLHGRPCYAVIKINSEKDRVEGKADTTMTIDGAAWKAFDDERRLALIGHECHHILVQRDKDGEIKSDDAGRPKLKLRPHDWEFGGFDEIARRYGRASIEVMTVRTLVDERRQLFWAWGDDQAPPDEVPPVKLAAV
jgi:hypothetical protein